MRKALPACGEPWESIESRMDELRTRDVDWRGGRLPFHIWYGGEDVVEIQKKGYMAFMQENGLGAGKSFQSLKVMEDDLLDFAAGLLHGPEAVGHLTSGGSESIFVAMKAAMVAVDPTKEAPHDHRI